MVRTLTRRQVLEGLALLAPVIPVRLRAQTTASPPLEPLDQAVLPRGVRSRFVNNVNGIRMHVLEAGFGAAPLREPQGRLEPGREAPGARPAVLLVHGFPELAYSWRKVMTPI